jgi:hypothetical protein
MIKVNNMNTKRFLFAMIAVIAICVMSGIASADPYYINFVDQDGGLAGYGASTLISSYALAPNSLIETFKGVAPPPPYPLTPISAYAASLDQAWTWGPGVSTAENDAVAMGSSTHAAAPWSHFTGARDATPYATIPYDSTASLPRQASVSFGADYRYLGLHWGSMDPEDGTWSQNIFLYDDGALVATVFAPLPKDGGQADADTNRYVNIFLTDGYVFDTAVFQSNQYAFEFDNLAVGTVPVPAAVLLGMLGLSVAGVKLRKFA